MNHVQVALDAFGALDDAGFLQAMIQVRTEFQCVGEPLRPEDVASLHLLEGLHASTTRDSPGPESSFCALQKFTSFEVPENVAPRSGALWTQIQDPSCPADAVVVLDPDLTLQVLVDGQVSATIPSNRAVVLQWGAPGGSVSGSLYKRPTDPMPAWIEVNGSSKDPTASATGVGAAGANAIGGTTGMGTPPSPVDRQRRPTPLLISAGISAGLGVGLYGYAYTQRLLYLDLDDPVPYGDLDGVILRNHVATTGAGALGVLALGLGLSAVVRF